MNSKYIAAIAVLMACLAIGGGIALTSDDSDAADSTYNLSTEMVTVNSAYSRSINGPGVMHQMYYTITGANWLSLTYVASNELRVTGTPTSTGTYSVKVTGPIAQGGAEGEWIWTINVTNTTTYKVTVYGRDNSVIGSATLAPGSTYTLPTLTDTANYRFNGYYTAANGGTYVGTSGTVITINSDRSIYSHWTVRTYYNVTIDLNGYYFHPNGQFYLPYTTYEKEAGTTFDFSVTDSFTKNGHIYNNSNELTTFTLKGWSLSPTGAIVSYSSFAVNSNVTYYAIWGIGGSGGDEDDLTFLGDSNFIIGISGDSYEYSPVTNIAGAVIEYTKQVSWLHYNSGYLSGYFPNVVEPTQYEVIFTATSTNPTQTATQSITFFVYPSMAYIDEPPTSMFMGESYDFDLKMPLGGVVYTISGVDWLVLSGDHIVGSAPTAEFDYSVELTITARHLSSNQTNTKIVNIAVNKILEFTSIPTSSFVASQIQGVDQYESFIIDWINSMFSESSAAAGDIDYFFSGNTVKFVFTGSDAESLKWYVNDELASESWTFTKSFSNGTYKISCIAENEVGTSEVFSVNISVEQGFSGLTIADYLIVFVIILLLLLVAIKLVKRKKNKNAQNNWKG